MATSVWFPGVHSDVGGGYVRDGLSRAPFRFMVQRLEAQVKDLGLPPVDWVQETLGQHLAAPDDITFDFHFHGLSRGFSLFGKSIRRIRVREVGGATGRTRPKIHGSLWDLWQSDSVYAETTKGRRWRVQYQPFNVRELNDSHANLRNTPGDWPFEWVDREPPGPGATVQTPHGAASPKDE